MKRTIEEEGERTKKMMRLIEKHSFPLDMHLMDKAAEYDDLDYMKALLGAGCEVSRYIYPHLIKAGNSEAIKWMMDNSLPGRDVGAAEAINEKNIPLMKLLLEGGPPPSEYCMINAAVTGDMDILMYVHEKGGALTAKVLSCAIEVKNSAVVEWLLENDCPCDGVSLEFSILYGGLDLTKRLYAKGCDATSNAMRAAFNTKNVEAIEWLESIGCKL